MSIPPALPLERWYEVVGVVPDFPANELEPQRRVYHPAAFGDLYPGRIGVRVRAGTPAAFSERLRQVSGIVNRDLQVRDIVTTDSLVKREQGLFRLMGVTVGLVMLSVIALSAAGIHSLMSFTVARRRREIGIRAALGADRHQLLVGIFSRAMFQVAVGVFVGLLGAVGIEVLADGEMLQSQAAIIVPLVAVVMMTVGLLAVLGPAREGLRIQPSEALREE